LEQQSPTPTGPRWVGKLGKPRVFAPTLEGNSLVIRSVLTLAVVLVTIKLGKVLAEFYFDNPHAAVKLAFNSWLCRAAVVFFAAFLLGSLAWPSRKWSVSVAPIFALIPIWVLIAVHRRVPSDSYRWIEQIFSQFWTLVELAAYLFRRDAIFLSTFAALAYLLVSLTPGRFYRPLKITITACVTFLLLISGLELSSYCKLGVTGSGHLLAFFLTNAASLWPMLRSELNATSVLVFLAPLVAGLMVLLLTARWYRRHDLAPARPLWRFWPAVVVVLIVAEIIHPAEVDHRFDRFGDNTYLALSDILPWHRTEQLEAVKTAERMPVLFDTAHATLQAQPGVPEKRRNVIIIMLESTRLNATSLADPSLRTTPFLAEFAKQSAVVPEMHAVIPCTAAAWVAILNGIWPSTDEDMRAWAEHKYGSPASLPALLSSHGYKSAYFTSGHLNFGYDAALIQNDHFGEVFDADNLPSKGFEHPTFWGFEDRIMVQPSLDWVKQERDQHDPFLLVMMTSVGHYDYRPPSSWKTQSFSADATYNRYLNCLRYIDSVLNEFITGLDRLGVLKSSIVIILGDHGESFGEHGLTAHSFDLYDNTLRIPAIIHADGLVPAGSRIPGLREEVDVFPTVIDALGMRTEDSTFSGTSMLKPVPDDRELFFSGSLYSQSIAMQKRNLKFIYNFDRTPTEVYEIDQDPNEKHDIARTLPNSAIKQADMDMLVWRERVSRAFAPDPNAASLR
jgi:lipoteichoic acid synthase